MRVTLLNLLLALGGNLLLAQRAPGPGELPQAILWEQPTPERMQALVQGQLGAEGAPRGPFTFVKEETGGTTPKVWVKDAAGRTWIAKWGPEIHADMFGARLAYAVGYYTAPTYFVAAGQINGVKGLGRAKGVVQSDGRFQNARLRLVDNQYEYKPGGWKWHDNPFVAADDEARAQLHGLKLLMILLSNWDAKDARNTGGGNTAVYLDKSAGNNGKAYFAVDDWGAAMGGFGNFFTREKWNCARFTSESGELIQDVDGYGLVRWGYEGKNKDSVAGGVLLKDVQWLLASLGQVTPETLRAGLLASGASEQDAQCFTNALTKRIELLQVAANEPDKLRSALRQAK